MPVKNGKGGHGQENYDPETGKYVNSKNYESTKNDNSVIGNFNNTAGEEKKDKPTGGAGGTGAKLIIKNKKKFAEVVKKRQELFNKKDDSYITKDINRKDREWKFNEDVAAVNPRYNEYGKGFNINCQRCAPTFVARFCWGLDVTAQNAVRDYNDYWRESNVNPYQLQTVYSVYENAQPVFHPGREGDAYRKQSWDELDNYMNGLPDKAVVQVTVEGHTFVVVRKNGKNICVEPQCPSYYTGRSEEESDNSVNESHRRRYTIDSYCRVDNLKPSRRFWDVCVNRTIKKV